MEITANEFQSTKYTKASTCQGGVTDGMHMPSFGEIHTQKNPVSIGMDSEVIHMYKDWKGSFQHSVFISYPL